MIKLHILNASGSLDLTQPIIEEEFDKFIKKIQAKIPVDKVDVVVYDYPEHTIPEIGIGGFTPTNHRVMIPIDPGKEDINSLIKSEFKRTLAHELYHCVKKYSFIGKKQTLLGSLINEGLADSFDIEVFKLKPHPWSIALSSQEIEKFLKLAEKEFENNNYNHEEWFFGSMKLPRWTGYSLGFYLVDKFFKKNPDKKPSTAYKLKTKQFLT